MSELLINVKGLKKRFCRELKRSLFYGIEDIARECFGMYPRSELRKGEFWANDDISFELKRGDCLGLIGGNGAGKSTLLKQIAGLIKPDAGEIEINGRVGALIELGAGFNPLLSGHENIYINGSVLGMGRREIDKKLDQILEFADIGDFIEAPVQSYSSGMKVRLGFAIAAHLEPDILLIDEVLAVGDAAFGRKCLNQINKIATSTAIIFVSHNVDFIRRITNKSLLLRDGKSLQFDNTDDAISHYMRLLTKTRTSNQSSDTVSLESYSISRQAKHQGVLQIDVIFSSKIPLAKGMIHIAFECPSFGRVAQCYSVALSIKQGRQTKSVIIDPLPLTSGFYSLNIGFCDISEKHSSPEILGGQANFCNVDVSGSPSYYNAPITINGDWTKAPRINSEASERNDTSYHSN